MGTIKGKEVLYEFNDDWLVACLLAGLLVCLVAQVLACLLDSLGAWSVWEAVSQPFSQVFMALFYVSWNTHMTKVQQIFHYFTSQINSSVIIRLYSLTDKCSTKSTQHTGAWNNCSLLSHCSYSFSLIMNKQTSISVQTTTTDLGCAYKSRQSSLQINS